MTTLSNKIDFAVVVSVFAANPNGDPLGGNRPRQDVERYGEISDVAIKRKIRNRLMDLGKKIFVQSDDRRADDDPYRSLKKRLEGVLGKEILVPAKKQELTDKACEEWLDVRAFGQVFAFGKEEKPKGKGKGGKKEKELESSADNDDEGEDSKSVSANVRGPVSIHPAFSVEPITITSEQITKSVNLEGDGSEMGSDRMGMKHRVDHGLYVFYGSMNPQLAKKPKFSNEDAKAIQKALISLFENDASSARPEGSMAVYRMYWWKHNSENGQLASAKVHNSVRSKIQVKDKTANPRNIEERYHIPDKSEVDAEIANELKKINKDPSKFPLECEVFSDISEISDDKEL